MQLAEIDTKTRVGDLRRLFPTNDALASFHLVPALDRLAEVITEGHEFLGQGRAMRGWSEPGVLSDGQVVDQYVELKWSWVYSRESVKGTLHLAVDEQGSVVADDSASYISVKRFERRRGAYFDGGELEHKRMRVLVGWSLGSIGESLESLCRCSMVNAVLPVELVPQKESVMRPVTQKSWS